MQTGASLKQADQKQQFSLGLPWLDLKTFLNRYLALYRITHDPM